MARSGPSEAMHSRATPSDCVSFYFQLQHGKVSWPQD